MYTTPTFNLYVGIWRPLNPITNPPDVECMGNLSSGRKMILLNTVNEDSNLTSVLRYLLVPKDTDIRDGRNNTGGDHVEVPQGTGCFYVVWGVGEVAYGFANQYRLAVVVPIPPYPEPYPHTV